MTGGEDVRRAVPYLLAVAVAAGLYLLTLAFPPPRPGTLGGAFWPRAAIALMAIAALWELIVIVRGAAARERRIDEEPDAADARHPLLLAGGIVLVVAYAAAITTLGYVLASFLFLVAFMYLGGYRRHRVIWASAVLGIIAVAFVFLKIVYVSLPRGVPPFEGWMQSLLRLIGIG